MLTTQLSKLIWKNHFDKKDHTRGSFAKKFENKRKIPNVIEVFSNLKLLITDSILITIVGTVLWAQTFQLSCLAFDLINRTLHNIPGWLYPLLYTWEEKHLPIPSLYNNFSPKKVFLRNRGPRRCVKNE